MADLAFTQSQLAYSGSTPAAGAQSSPNAAAALQSAAGASATPKYAKPFDPDEARAAKGLAR